MGQYTVSGSGADCKSAGLASVGSTPTWPTINQINTYGGEILMLDKPVHGWSTIKIGGWFDRCSYLDDVPVMLLQNMITFFEGKMYKPVSIKFDAEGYEYILTLDTGMVHVITEQDEGYKLHSEEVDFKQLAKELASDILRDIDGWTTWLSYAPWTKNELVEREKELCELSKKLETFL